MEIAISTDTLLCSSCLLGFESQSEYKQHYATKFHQYNIKRKLINLSPITLEQYEERLNQFSQKSQQQKDTNFKARKNYCETCGKGFGNENTFKNHMLSKKHQENEEKKSVKSQTLSKQSSQSNIYQKTSQRSTLNDQSICLFCDDKKPDIEINLIHMEKKHGFFIPEKKYVSDMKGLLKYLAEKINIGLLCIECENKGYKDFKTPEALKTHMIDKGHCFMNTKTFQEYAAFYDFSVNKEDGQIDEKEEEQEVQQEKDLKQKKKDESLDKSEENQDDEWEDEESEDDEEDEEESEQQDETITEQEKKNKKEQEKKFLKNYKKLNLQRIANFQINHMGEVELLDQGKTLGHRKYKQQYNTYYRNRADPLRGLKSILGDSYAKTRQVMIANKINQIALANKFERQQGFRKQELQDFKHKFRDNRYKLWVQLNNNQTTMHHYRNQNPL